MKHTLVIFDENLLYVIIYNEISLTILNEIESKIGSIIISDDMYESYINTVKRHEHSALTRDIWRRMLQKYNLFYNNIIDMLYENILLLPRKTILNEIKDNNIIIRRLIKMYDPSISSFDTSLIALSHFIKINTQFEPIIISEDSHLLIHGNCISNFLGICNGFLSIYEALKILNFGDCLKNYLEFRNISGENHQYNTISNKTEFADLINELSKRNFLSYHPRINYR